MWLKTWNGRRVQFLPQFSGEDLKSLFRILKFLAHARMQLGPQLRLFTLLLMQPIRITRIRVWPRWPKRRASFRKIMTSLRGSIGTRVLFNML